MILAPVVSIKGDGVFANSRDVAAFFEKEHKHVLRDIRALILNEPLTGSNFEPSEYADASGKTNPTMDMTRDGFTLLAMGFTGKKVVAFDRAYINAFNRMGQMVTRVERSPGYPQGRNNAMPRPP